MNSISPLYQNLGNSICIALKDVFDLNVSATELQLQKTRKEFAGNVTLVVFPIAGKAGKRPEELANMLGRHLADNTEIVAGFNVVKGFLNLEISVVYWLEFLHQIATAPAAFASTNEHIMVEFSSPNTNKPLHLGHLRNIFLGDSVARILECAGNKVTRVQIINDRGIHICKSMVAWLKFGNGETPESSGVKGDKLVGKYYVAFDTEHKRQLEELKASGITEDETPMMQEAREMLRSWETHDASTVALWKKMNHWVYEGFDASYKRMKVNFDKLYYESDTYLLGKKEVEEGVTKGIFNRREDNSIWVDLTAEGLDQKALLRKDGTSMYITQDIGTAILRFREYNDLSYQIYTVGNEQEYHFKVLFKVLELLGFEQAKKCFHLSYGMVELPDGKMKSREGNVVDADDIMQEMAQVACEVAAEQGKLEGIDESEKLKLFDVIGMGALKYFLLRVNPSKNMLFDPKESIDFNGNTGPSIQYTYVRTCAILRRMEEDSLLTIGAVNVGYFHQVFVEKSAIDVIIKLHDWPTILSEAASSYDPSVIAGYSYDLARSFNAFYQECPILRETDSEKRNLRLIITRLTGQYLHRSMAILGIDMPERM
jgi:arginyl-tRNA synthetase